MPDDLLRFFIVFSPGVVVLGAGVILAYNRWQTRRIVKSAQKS